MKKFLCALLCLVACLGTWTGSATDPVVARIAFISDTHVNLRTNESGVAYNRRTDEAFAAANAEKVDLVLIAGDLTDGGEPKQMELFKQKVNQLKAPVLFVPGNHDVGVLGDEKTKTSITPERVELFAKKLGPNWFAREVAGVRVVGLNSCLFGTGFKEEAEQWKFLEKELAGPHREPTLVLEHYPAFLKTADEPGQGTWNVPPEPRQRLIQLLKRGGVRTLLSGHLHRPIANRLDGILFLSNAAIAFGLPRDKQEEGWMLLTVPREGEVRFDFRPLR